MVPFELNLAGECLSCKKKDTPHTEAITCDTCKKMFHAICPSATNKQDTICNVSFLKLWQSSSTKNNFKWHCDTCLTDMETAKSASLEAVVHTLVQKVSDLTNEVQQIKQPQAVCSDNSTSAFAPVTYGGSWSDPKAVQNLRSSLVIKPVADADGKKSTVNLENVRKIAVDNNIPVSKVGVSANGNTFIHCPSSAARDKLQPLLASNNPNQSVKPLQEKFPSISITGITEAISKDDLVTEVRKQNDYINTLIENGNTFKVLFMKPPTENFSNYQVIALVSPAIRDAITANRNRLFIGLQSCRVYDRFYVKRCNKCNDFGHYRAQCTKKATCGYCASEDHESDQCPLKISKDYSQFKCINCKRNGLPCEGHSASWFNCPSYIIAQKKMKSTISYYESRKNQSRHPV